MTMTRPTTYSQKKSPARREAVQGKMSWPMSKDTGRKGVLFLRLAHQPLAQALKLSLEFIMKRNHYIHRASSILSSWINSSNVFNLRPSRLASPNMFGFWRQSYK